jgi:hypothetical protein
MTLRIGCLTVDARDCQRLAGFWSHALGWTIVESTDAGVCVVPSESVGKDMAVPGLLLFSSPDEKFGKNRVHLDLRPDDQAAEVEGWRAWEQPVSTSVRPVLSPGWSWLIPKATSSVSFPLGSERVPIKHGPHVGCLPPFAIGRMPPGRPRERWLVSLEP